MNLLSDLVTGILRAFTKLALIAFAAVFALVVLIGILVVVAVALIRFLLTGRKPAVFATVSRFRQGAQQFRTGAWPANGSAGGRYNDADVVDVEAREVHEARAVLNAPLSPKIPD